MDIGRGCGPNLLGNCYLKNNFHKKIRADLSPDFNN